MKKIACFVFMGLMLCAATALADVTSLLKPIWVDPLANAIQSVTNTATGEGTENIAVTCDDERFDVVRASVYTDNEYSAEAYVYAELRNVTEETLYLSGMTLTVCNSANRSLHEENYISVSPDIVAPNETFVMSEWLYDFVSDLSAVDHMVLHAQTNTYMTGGVSRLNDATAYMDDNRVYAEVRNDTDETIFNIDVAVILSDSEGNILDICTDSTYGSIGLTADSSLVFRWYRLNDLADDLLDGAVCEVRAYKEE